MDDESFHRYCRLILEDRANSRWEAFSGKLSSKLAAIYNKLHLPYSNIVTYYSSINIEQWPIIDPPLPMRRKMTTMFSE